MVTTLWLGGEGNFFVQLLSNLSAPVNVALLNVRSYIFLSYHYFTLFFKENAKGPTFLLNFVFFFFFFGKKKKTK
jgi:hypothetical protein